MLLHILIMKTLLQRYIIYVGGYIKQFTPENQIHDICSAESVRGEL